MYRCVALLSLAAPSHEPSELASAARIELPAGRVLLDEEDVTERIRSPEVSRAASWVAADPGVREAMVARQREIMADGDWVAEGRDIGTVVAPGADLKIFLTADEGERARRRAAELGQPQESVLADQQARDRRDTEREHAPLRPSDGSVIIDSTGLDAEQVIARIAALARGPRERF